MIRTKLEVNKIEITGGQARTWDKTGGAPFTSADLYKIHFLVPCDRDEKFFKDTPECAIELICVGEYATKFFQRGKQYYVDFEEVK